MINFEKTKKGDIIKHIRSGREFEFIGLENIQFVKFKRITLKNLETQKLEFYLLTPETPNFFANVK